MQARDCQHQRNPAGATLGAVALTDGHGQGHWEEIGGEESSSTKYINGGLYGQTMGDFSLIGFLNFL